jgi:MoxR-like ATPase
MMSSRRLLAQGHVLLEGLPGLGKTELVKALSRLLSLDFRRIQFTPDLLPTDITGSHILEEREGRKEFTFHQGPVFTNLLLADEINRASPKTQAALLEAMQERRVTTFRGNADVAGAVLRAGDAEPDRVGGDVSAA